MSVRDERLKIEVEKIRDDARKLGLSTTEYLLMCLVGITK